MQSNARDPSAAIAASPSVALIRSEGHAPIRWVADYEVESGGGRLLKGVGDPHHDRRGAACSRGQVRQQQLDHVLPKTGSIGVKLEPLQPRADLPKHEPGFGRRKRSDHPLGCG